MKPDCPDCSSRTERKTLKRLKSIDQAVLFLFGAIVLLGLLTTTMLIFVVLTAFNGRDIRRALTVEHRASIVEARTPHGE
jgi:hypothetical protein